MILTLYYMYATLVQWWRLGVLRRRLGGTLHAQNALVLCSSTSAIGDAEPAADAAATDGDNGRRALENLLYQQDGRIACTVVPRQTVRLAQWACFPKDRKSFPLHYRCAGRRSRSSGARVHLLLQARLDNDLPRKIDFLQMESFGELIAWRAQELFEVVIKSDLERLSILMNSFRFHAMGINHDLPLVKVETVDVDGTPGKIKYDRRPSKLKCAHGPGHIQEFAAVLRQLYSKVNENFNPKIMIENGASRKCEHSEKKPVSEVKPNKKSTKNTLDVHPGIGHKKKHKDKEVVEESKVKEVKAKPKSSDVKDVKVDKQKAKEVKDLKEKGNVEEKVELAKQEPKKEVVKDKVQETLKNEDKPSKSPKVVEKVKEKTPNVPKSSATLSVTKKSYSDVAASPGKNLQRQNATSNSKETSPNRSAKPPNILVYADTSLAKENVKYVLKTIINQDRYTVYDFPAVPPISGENFWNASTTLVVVCGQVPAALTGHLLGYLVNGGRLLCLCSDLLYSVLQPFSTAEVREHELVRFTYGEWKRVKMMHHIFCYQASPAKKQFSREASDQSMNGGGGGSSGSSPVAPRTPSLVDIQHDGRRHTIQVQVLGAEETWQTPSLLLASVRGGEGKAIFSQVHLEVDPTQYQDDESKFGALRDSNQARLEIMKHILSSHLDIDCCSKPLGALKHTPGYFLGRHDLKMKVIQSAAIVDGQLDLHDLRLTFLTSNVDPPEAQADHLPIMVLRCPTDFNTVEYFDTLETQRVGKMVIYSEVMASTQRLLTTSLADGLAVIAKRQTSGKGRSGNEWLSPEGCAMFSIQLHVPLDSPLGRSLPLVQHLVMVAVVTATQKASGLAAKLEIGLKWPNDLYAYGNIKIGGLVASSTVQRNEAVVTVGCGVNLNNREPTICINDMIRDLDKNHAGLSPEKFLASCFNEVERLVDATQLQGVDHLLGEYYRHWLHTDASIVVTTADGSTKNVTIKGVDSCGFLTVVADNGEMSSVQSDGNTFDMLRGLIAPKLT